MNVVDSSGWLEYFAKEENSTFFAPVIRAIESLIVPTVSMYEVFKRTAQQRGDEEALNAVAWMSTGQVVALTQELALAAAVLSLEYKLPMTDSIILATAQMNNATLWTQDEHFKDLEGVKYIEKK